jgi:hypothetical protein
LGGTIIKEWTLAGRWRNRSSCVSHLVEWKSWDVSKRRGLDALQSEMCGAMDVEVRVRVFGVDVERGGLFEEKKL